MAPTVGTAGWAWQPWAVTLAIWLIACLAFFGVLEKWHLREQDVLEEQANAIVNSLGSALRAMSGRVQRTDGMLDRILSEVAESAAIGGIALQGQTGQCLARVQLPQAWLVAGQGAARGSHYYEGHILVWDTVDVGQYRPGRSPQGFGGHGGDGEHARRDTMKLFVSMPLGALHDRWERDRLAVAILCLLALGVAVGTAVAWSFARHSATYSAQLRLAEEESRTLAEVNLVAAGLAHEIKNPLGVVRGTAQRLAGRRPQERDTSEALAVIIEEIDRTTSRVNELLSFANPREPALAAIGLRRELESLERLMAEELVDADLSLDCEAVPEDAVVEADPDQLRRLLFNLLHNAIRYAPGGGPIEVTLPKVRGDHFSLRLRDRGPGVPLGMREKVFSAYFTTRADGTGLGLAVAKRIARAHGWTITCGEAPGGGALFEIAGINIAPTNQPD
jgi:signal transduction histidine kinase